MIRLTDASKRLVFAIPEVDKAESDVLSLRTSISAAWAEHYGDQNWSQEVRDMSVGRLMQEWLIVGKDGDFAGCHSGRHPATFHRLQELIGRTTSIPELWANNAPCGVLVSSFGSELTRFEASEALGGKGEWSGTWDDAIAFVRGFAKAFGINKYEIDGFSNYTGVSLNYRKPSGWAAGYANTLTYPDIDSDFPEDGVSSIRFNSLGRYDSGGKHTYMVIEMPGWIGQSWTTSLRDYATNESEFNAMKGDLSRLTGAIHTGHYTNVWSCFYSVIRVPRLAGVDAVIVGGLRMEVEDHYPGYALYGSDDEQRRIAASLSQRIGIETILFSSDLNTYLSDHTSEGYLMRGNNSVVRDYTHKVEGIDRPIRYQVGSKNTSKEVVYRRGDEIVFHGVPAAAPEWATHVMASELGTGLVFGPDVLLALGKEVQEGEPANEEGPAVDEELVKAAAFSSFVPRRASMLSMSKDPLADLPTEQLMRKYGESLKDEVLSLGDETITFRELADARTKFDAAIVITHTHEVEGDANLSQAIIRGESVELWTLYVVNEGEEEERHIGSGTEAFDVISYARSVDALIVDSDSFTLNEWIGRHGASLNPHVVQKYGEDLQEAGASWWWPARPRSKQVFPNLLAPTRSEQGRVAMTALNLATNRLSHYTRATA